MKAYYYLGQAQLALRHPNEALSSALRAYELALHTKSPSTANISSFILDAKKEKWEARERERLRRRAGLVVELEESITTGGKRAMGEIRDRQETGEIGAREARDEIEEVEAETRKKVEELRSVFALADPENAKRREVPDWMVDSITFQVMQDPVTTKL
jgi:STIP1 family protein 1